MRPAACLLAVVAALAWAAPVRAQAAAGTGARALGMAGAFTAVADDASAVYWNPAGTATGAYASLVIDWRTHESGGADDDRNAPAVRGSGTLVAVTTPVVGAGYYRIQDTRLGPVFRQPASSGSEDGRVGQALLTDHFAVTLAQSLADGVHVGVALKAVRGRAATTTFSGHLGGSVGGQWQALEDRYGPAATKFDADVGLMLDGRKVRFGVSARNLTAPSFPTSWPGEVVTLSRRVRTGVAVLPRDRVVVSVDADLTTADEADGKWRGLALGTEVWTASRRFGVTGRRLPPECRRRPPGGQRRRQRPGLESRERGWPREQGRRRCVGMGRGGEGGVLSAPAGD